MKNWRKALEYLGSLNLVCSIALVVLAVQGALAIRSGVRHGMESANSEQLIMAYSWLPVLGAAGILVCAIMMLIAASLLTASLGLLLSKRWGAILTIIVLGTCVAVLLPAAILTIAIPDNWSPLSVVFGLIITYVVAVISLLLSPGARAALR